MVPPAKMDQPRGLGDQAEWMFFGKVESVAPTTITLTTEEFALLYEYLDREHSIVWDPDIIGDTTKIGKKLWDRVQEIAEEQHFTPTHEPLSDDS
jgi:hypothetical protein